MSLSWKIGIAAAFIFCRHSLCRRPNDTESPSQHGWKHRFREHDDGDGASKSRQPTAPGQDAFGAIQEIVGILEADPGTDWSKINIAALREHLIEMNEVTLHAKAVQQDIDSGVEITITGEDRTFDAIKRMIPAHAPTGRPNGPRRVSSVHHLTPCRIFALGVAFIKDRKYDDASPKHGHCQAKTCWAGVPRSQAPLRHHLGKDVDSHSRSFGVDRLRHCRLCRAGTRVKRARHDDIDGTATWVVSHAGGALSRSRLPQLP